MPFAATRTQLTIILSEVNQKEKDKYHMLSLLCGTENTAQMNTSMMQDSDTENRLVAAKGVGGGEGWTGTLELIDANCYI